MHETGRVEDATMRLAMDVAIHYAEWGDREGEAIMFLHGYSASWYSFGRVLPCSRLSSGQWPDYRIP